MEALQESYIAIKNNWQARPASEKKILLLVATVFVCGLFYLIIAEPLISWREQLSAQRQAKDRIYTQVERLVERYQRSENTQQPVQKKALATIIDNSLQQYQLNMQGFQPGQENDARLRLNNVAYPPLIQWLHHLEYQQGLVIAELSIVQNKKNKQLQVNVRVQQ